MSNWLHAFSLRSKGARHQLAVAIALVAIIPLLSFAFIVTSAFVFKGTYSVWAQTLICLLALAVGTAGFVMLRRYPRHIESLRNYLKGMAEGELPAEIRLSDDTDDVSAIARYLNTILVEMRRKVELLEEQLRLSQEMQKTIKAQADELLEAERHRVMIESLGTAVHHIGQPATVLRLYMDSISRSHMSDETREKVEECRQAIESISDILSRLRNVSDYRTVPYRPLPPGTAPRDGDRILDIESK